MEVWLKHVGEATLEEAGVVGSVRSKPGGRQTAGQLLLGSKLEMMVAWTRKWQWGKKK